MNGLELSEDRRCIEKILDFLELSGLCFDQASTQLALRIRSPWPEGLFALDLYCTNYMSCVIIGNDVFSI